MTASGDFHHLIAEALRLQASDLPQALLFAREAYDIADPNDHAQCARAATLLGGLLRLRGGYKESEALLKQGLSYEPELKVALSAHTQLGQVYLERGMVDEARASFASALQLLEGQDLPDKLAAVHLNLGNLYSKADPGRALMHYGMALTSYTRVGDETGIATVQANMGVLAQQQGRHAEALETFAQASRLLASLEEERLRAIVLHRSAISHYHLGEYALALGECRAALAIAHKQHLLSVTARLLRTEATLLHATSEPELAGERLEEAEAMREMLHMSSVEL